MLNNILLVICICIVIVLVLFLFYWNRFLAYLLGILFRFAFWNQEDSSIWLDIEAIQFSVLGGRILFKDLRYHSSNQTIIILKGQISWRYWIRAPAQEADLSNVRTLGEGLSAKLTFPSCRVHVALHGLEWFIYNRTASYENIIASLVSSASGSTAGTQHHQPDGRGTLARSLFGATAIQSSLFAPPSSFISSLRERTPAFVKSGWAWLVAQLPNLDPKDLLPLSIEVNTAAITIGNTSTPTLLVAEFQKADGTYGVVPSRSKHDLYKQALKLTLWNAVLRYADNAKQTSNMQQDGEKFAQSIINSDPPSPYGLSYLSFPGFQKFWKHLKLWRVLPSRPKSHLSAVHTLAAHAKAFQDRHRQGEEPKEETPYGQEYVKERKILETPQLELLYYADVAGTVPPHHANTDGHTHDPINGGLPPEWGVELVMKGGFIRYGPWTDRKRTELQQTFFPPNYTNYVPQRPLRPGEFRIWTCLQIFIELRDGVTLEIPFREPSKNWMWDGKVEYPGRPRKREAASIHIRAGDRSTINYVAPMVASSAGYEPSLEIHLDTVSVTSSLNDIRLLEAESCRIRCDLPSPLKWREKRQWTFAVSLRRPSLYLLRDHVNMLSDLGRDWSSGPHTDYHRFIPMVYAVDLDFHNFEVTTNLNDQNIIDKPLNNEENALLKMHGLLLRSGIRIPLTKYRPDSTLVSFWIDAPELAVGLNLPQWNTHSLFPTPHRSEIGHIGRLYLDGSYRYYAEVFPAENIDRLTLNFSTSNIIYKATGWTIRHFMILRDNYFGSFTHFSTLKEYIQRMDRKQPLGDPIGMQYREGSSNAIQVELALVVENGLMIMPAGLPGYEIYSLTEAYNLDNVDIGECMLLRIPSLQLQLRTNEYYMEMSLNVDMISGHAQRHCSEKLWSVDSTQWNTAESFVIDNLDITANRLFGPQPATSTYVCIWEVHVGAIRSTLSATEGRIFAAAGSAFGLNFGDPLNAPASTYAIPLDPDVTFIKLTVDQVHIVWQVDRAAVEIALPNGIRYCSNDVPGKLHRKSSSVCMPQVYFKMLLASRNRPDTWYEAATAELDANLDIYSAPDGWQEHASAQRAFVAAQDMLTNRVGFLYNPEAEFSKNSKGSGRGIIESDLYLPQLRIPPNRATLDAREQRLREKVSMSPSYTLPPIFLASDSEEEVFSEADRDARLANSRPPAMESASFHDQESMSSGDESDNGDDTDGMSDTDYSDVPDGDSLETVQTVANFASITTRYRAQNLSSPLLWRGSPFLCSKYKASCLKRSPRRLRPTATDPTSSPSPDLDIDTDGLASITVIHFESPNGLSVFLTPLAFPVVSALLSDIAVNHLSPELRVDGLLASQVRSHPPTQAPVSNGTLFKGRIPSIQLVSNHSVVGLEERPSSQTLHTNSIPQPRSLVSIVVDVDNLCVRGQLTRGDSGPSSKLCSSFDSSSLGLDVHGHGPTGHTRAASCVVSDQTWAKWVDSAASIAIASATTKIEHRAPRLLVSCIDNLSRSVHETGALYKRTSSTSSPSAQQLVHRILGRSRGKVIIDSLSAIQPSFLVQSGRPHRLRKDPTIKFLIYLRNCLRYVDAAERRMITGFHESVTTRTSADELIHLMENEILQAELEPSFRNNPFMCKVFPDLEPSHHPRERPQGISFESFRIGFQDFRVSILHPGPQPPSVFDVGHFEVTLHQRLTEWTKVSSPISKRSFVTLSSRVDAPQSVLQLILSITVGDVTFTVYPHLMQFAQELLRAHRSHKSTSAPKLQKPVSVSKRPNLYYVDVALLAKSFQFKAAAERLIIEYRTTGVSYASTSLLRKASSSPTTWELSMTHSLTFSEIRLQACGVSDTSNMEDYSVLAALVLAGGRGNVVFSQEAQTCPVFRAIGGLQNLQLNVPRSAMRLYRFGEEWRADYLAAIDSEIHELLSEFNKSRKPQSLSSRTSNELTAWNFQVHARLNRVRVSLQVMHGTWLSWELRDNIAYLTSHSGRRTARAFGLRIGSQMFGITSHTSSHGSSTPSHIQVRFHIPSFSTNGRYDGKQIQALALVEFFHLTVKPSYWDTLLTVQQKFGQDFNDFFKLIEETRRKSGSVVKYNQTPPTKTPFSVLIKMKGFRVGLEGLNSTLFLECEDVNGGVNNLDVGFGWHLNLLDLALSLAPQVNMHTRMSSFDPDRRSAFVIVDFRVSMATQTNAPPFDKHLQLTLTKAHSVMQPSSIGELGDFVDHLQAEILLRKEQRANELAAFKEKTQSILRTFDVKIGDNELQTSSWWDAYIIDIRIKNVGFAFPLAHESNLQLPRMGSQDAASVRAFLFSIKSIVFGTHRGESGEVTMRGFSFQFVSRFKRSEPQSFQGETHQTRNRLLYPVMTAQLRSEHSQDSRRVHIVADVDGFILDIESTIPDYISSLIEVYNRGKERVEKLTSAIPRSPQSPQRSQSSASDGYGAILTSNIFASLTFSSGKVRMYSKASTPSPHHRTRPTYTPTQETSDQQSRELGAEVFNLPVVSVWGEYRATPALSKVAGVRSHEPSMLLFKSTIHSSQNTLRPTLLPFLTELIRSIEDHMRTTTWRDSHASSISQDISASISSPSEPEEVAADPVASMQICLSLRIDQSKLELTCQPDVNVVAGLHWDSGGFVINIWPGTRKLAFSGSVGGLTAGLKHGFLSDDCVRLDAHNLAFSLTFAKSENDTGEVASSISVVLDTEFSGGVRLSRFQDVLCFKAVWLDHIPMFYSNHTSPPASAVSRSTSHKSTRSPTQEFTTAVLVRLRQIRLDVDLGQSISTLDLCLNNTIVRTKMTEDVAEVSLSVAEVLVSATGNVGGRMNLPDFKFQTIRKTKWIPGESSGVRMLDLGMTSGPLDLELESDFHKLIHYRAEPLKISIYDDWSRLCTSLGEEEPRVDLTFTVIGTDVIAMMNVGTIPKIVSYANKFMANLEAQREGACRESKAFRDANPPKADNPLSAVANAMLTSARSKLKETDAVLSYAVAQTLKLKLRFLQLVVFPRSMNDSDLAQLIGTDIEAQLDRLVAEEHSTARRDLHLSFSSLTISRLSQLNQSLASRDNSPNSRDWLVVLTKGVPEATIFGLPSMNMWMRSDEEITDLERTIAYDFRSTFTKSNAQDPEDIFITLNMSLYSWLTILRKTFAREMSQANSSVEGRSGVAQLAVQQRKKMPETASKGAPVLSLPKVANANPTVSREPGNVPGTPAPPLSPSTSTFAQSAPDDDKNANASASTPPNKTSNSITYKARNREIQRLTMRQLGEATPNIQHPFFLKKAGFNLEDSLPQYVHEYATLPTEEMMRALLKLYSRQLKAIQESPRRMIPPTS